VRQLRGSSTHKVSTTSADGSLIVSPEETTDFRMMRTAYTVEAGWLEARPMKKLRIVVALPNDNAYQHEQGVVAKSTGEKLGLELRVLQANDDSITQSQQLLEIIQSPPEHRPSALLVEPVTATGLRRVAEAAVAAGIAWVISNSDVDYVKELRKNTRVPVFVVTQGQSEIGGLQGKQLAALLPRGGSVLFLAGPSMSSVAVQRREGMESAMPQNVQLTTLRSRWSEEGAYQSASAWLRLATSRAEKFDLVAGQTHELAVGARKAFQNVENPEQKKRWLEVPFIGIGISNQVKPLVDGCVLAAAVVTSVTMELALRLLVRAIETQVQPPERSTVEVSSYPELERLTVKA
jgi:ABC-type sugar transport system substrate-binding protein